MTIACLLFSALVLIGAVWVVVLPNLFRAALSLGLVLLGIAALFILLGAEFLAFVQILVYVGAILTLVMFAIMLTGKRAATETRHAASRRSIPALAASLALFIVLVRATSPLRGLTAVEQPALLSVIGQELVQTFVLPFEVISLLFVIAIVGAIVLASSR